MIDFWYEITAPYTTEFFGIIKLAKLKQKMYNCIKIQYDHSLMYVSDINDWELHLLLKKSYQELQFVQQM